MDLVRSFGGVCGYFLVFGGGVLMVGRLGSFGSW